MEVNGRWTVIGLSSWGYSCGKVGAPGVFTKLSEFIFMLDKDIGMFCCLFFFVSLFFYCTLLFQRMNTNLLNIPLQILASSLNVVQETAHYCPLATTSVVVQMALLNRSLVVVAF